MNSLVVEINGVSYSDRYCYMTIGYDKTILDATVFVDGSDLLNHFNVTCKSDWLTMKRVRNSITFVAKPNVTLNDRAAIIEFTHNLVADAYVRISIKQNKAEYTITADNTNILFNTLLDKDCADKEVETVNVSAVGGWRDYGISPVLELARNAGEGALDDIGDDWPTSVDDIKADNYYTVKYDQGIKITKIDRNVLEITNYGKLSLYDKVYYVIKLYHLNDPSQVVEIYVGYINSNENNGTGFDLDDGE